MAEDLESDEAGYQAVPDTPETLEGVQLRLVSLSRQNEVLESSNKMLRGILVGLHKHIHYLQQNLRLAALFLRLKGLETPEEVYKCLNTPTPEIPKEWAELSKEAITGHE
jgi:hypothetical protein